jgi:hypothetical protein
MQWLKVGQYTINPANVACISDDGHQVTVYFIAPYKMEHVPGFPREEGTGPFYIHLAGDDAAAFRAFAARLADPEGRTPSIGQAKH